MEENYYEILEVNKNASPEIIEKAYKTLVKKVKAEINQTEEGKAASSEDVEPAPVLETDNYSSIKEACMLGEYYFNTDSYTIDTPEAKSNKLVEQISLLIAREHNDPLYNELLKEAVYTNRLHEAVTKKYKNEAVPKAEMITKKKELCESLSLDELNKGKAKGTFCCSN